MYAVQNAAHVTQDITQTPVHYVGSFLDYLQSRNCSPHTLRAYQTDLADLYGYTPTGNLSVSDADRYVTWLVGKGLSTSSVHRKLAACRSYYDFLIRYGVVDKNPFVGVVLPKREQRLPDTPQPEIVSQALQAIPRSIMGYRDRALISLLFGSGARIAEVLAMTMPDLHSLDRREIRVIGKGDKERILVLSQQAVAAMKDYLTHSRNILLYLSTTNVVFLSRLNEPLSYQGAKKIIQTRFAAVGHQTNPHALRHAFATTMSEHDVDLRVIQTALGHAAVQTTTRYIQTEVKRVHEAVERSFE
jgi:site-specific recombinase XerD